MILVHESQKWEKMVAHHILLSREEKTSVGGVVGLIGRRIALIHHKPLSPTLIPTIHVPIVVYLWA